MKVDARPNRRTALATLIAGGLGPLLPRSSFATGIDIDRYAAPVEITADDIAWFRECRSVWVASESGAPAVVPGKFTQEEFYRQLSQAREALGRLERTLCAFFVHGRFDSNRYTLTPPVRLQEAFVGAPTLVDFNVSPDHLRLFQHTNWRQSTIDSKRPYGNYTFYMAEMAEILGIPVPEGKDDRGRDIAMLPAETEARLKDMHHDMLFVLQAYLQHADLNPGRYVIPFDGWASWTLPRCRPVTSDQVHAYVRAMAQIKAQKFSKDTDKIGPIFRANALLFGDPNLR
jgi:hypothetical protein